MNEIKLLEKNGRSAETASSNVVPDELSEKLAKELEYCSAHTKNNAHGFVAKVMTAEFQEDAVTMGRVVTMSTVMVMTSDADIPVLSGDNCIAIKDFTKERNIQIVSTSGETLRNAMGFLSMDSCN